MARMSLICGIVPALILGAQPAGAFTPLPEQLGYADVANFATPGAVWCFEPDKNTCSFITVSTEPVKQNPRYDVLEMWDAKTVLTTHTGGVLRQNGVICERGTGFIDTAKVTDLDGTPVSNIRLAEIKSDLRGNWEGAENTQYCYAYVPNAAAQDGLFDQILFVDGELTDGTLTFLIDYSANARDSYRLRPPE